MFSFRGSEPTVSAPELIKASLFSKQSPKEMVLLSQTLSSSGTGLVIFWVSQTEALCLKSLSFRSAVAFPPLGAKQGHNLCLGVPGWRTSSLLRGRYF